MLPECDINTFRKWVVDDNSNNNNNKLYWICFSAAHPPLSAFQKNCYWFHSFDNIKVIRLLFLLLLLLLLLPLSFLLLYLAAPSSLSPALIESIIQLVKKIYTEEKEEERGIDTTNWEQSTIKQIDSDPSWIRLKTLPMERIVAALHRLFSADSLQFHVERKGRGAKEAGRRM